jgi:hypothetical protein
MAKTEDSMVRSLRALSAAVALFLCTSTAHAIQQSCGPEEYAVNYSQRQTQLAQNRLLQQQNSVIRLQNQIDTRTLSLQLQVDQALAWKQSAAGLSAGNAVGCAIRTIFWGGGRCFGNSAAQVIRIQSQANARYNLAVNRLTTYQNSSAMQLSRAKEREAQAQMQYDSAVNRFAISEGAYLKCEAAQRKNSAA